MNRLILPTLLLAAGLPTLPLHAGLLSSSEAVAEVRAGASARAGLDTDPAPSEVRDEPAPVVVSGFAGGRIGSTLRVDAAVQTPGSAPAAASDATATASLGGTLLGGGNTVRITGTTALAASAEAGDASFAESDVTTTLLFGLTFEVDEPTAWRLTSDTDDDAVFNAIAASRIDVSLRDAVDDSVVLRASFAQTSSGTTPPEEEIDAAGTLAAGRYTLRFETTQLLFADQGFNTNTIGGTGGSIDFTLVPEPTAAALLAGTGLLLLRRRRA